MKILLSCALAVTLTASHAYAQNPQRTPSLRPAPEQGAIGEIGGSILDGVTGEAVGGATVAVMNAADSSLVTGALTRTDGSFRLQGLPPGEYYLRVSHLGHQTTHQGGIILTSADPQVTIGAVRLAAAAVILEGIQVTVAADVRISADRNAYSTRDMPSTAGGNSTDVLRNVPAVEVDEDGRVSLRGSQNVAVQINGRAAPMRGDQLGQFLQQLPANMVDRVEVVPNPSAKYDPEGMAGIINIVLKQNTDLGVSGGLTLAAGTGGRYNGTGNLGYQRGALTLFGSYGYMDDARRTLTTSTRENLMEGASVRSIRQRGIGRSLSRSHTLNTSAEWKLGRVASLGSTVLLSDRTYENGSTSGRISRDAAGGVVSQWNDDLMNSSNDAVFEGTLSFRRPVEAGRDDFTAELRYNWLDVDMRHALDLTPGLPDGVPDRTRRTIDAVNDDLSFQADLTRMVGGARVETGGRIGRRRVTNGINAERAGTSGQWESDPARSFDFGTDETTRAAYLVLTRNTGPWEVQGGIRAERTNRGFQGTDDAAVSYGDLFPSALVAYTLGSSRLVKASYSRRIQRPQTFMLNSITFYEDPLNRSRGNPGLRPEYTNAFELGYQESGSWGSFQFSPFFRRTQGAIRVVRSVQGDTTTGVFTNLDRSQSYGADANASFRGALLSGSVGMNAFRHETGGASTAGNVYGSGLGWSVRANGNLKLSARTDVQGSAQYRAPMTVQQGRVGWFASTSFSARHKVLGERGSLSLRLADPFNTMRNRRTTDASAEELPYWIESERTFGARAVTLGFSYNFGNAPKLRAPRPQEPQAGGETGGD
jgi:outer membrane receptor protein involved in Fe transport